MSKLLLVCRLAMRDIRRRPAQAALLLLAITAASATLTMALVLHGVTSNPYAQTRAATSGPDLVALLGGGPALRLALAVVPRADPAGPARAELYFADHVSGQCSDPFSRGHWSQRAVPGSGRRVEGPRARGGGPGARPRPGAGRGRSA